MFSHGRTHLRRQVLHLLEAIAIVSILTASLPLTASAADPTPDPSASAPVATPAPGADEVLSSALFHMKLTSKNYLEYL